MLYSGFIFYNVLITSHYEKVLEHRKPSVSTNIDEMKESTNHHEDNQRDGKFYNINKLEEEMNKNHSLHSNTTEINMTTEQPQTYTTFHSISTEDLFVAQKYLQKNLEESKKAFNISDSCLFNASTLKTDIPIQIWNDSWSVLENNTWARDIKDGEWSPPNCAMNKKIAIIIPYRDRLIHLKTFINHINKFLQNQMTSYGIFVVEQAPGGTFNKAILMNVGFKEAVKRNYSCFVFHDVDMLPIDERNLYQCQKHPLHLSLAVDKFNYKLEYSFLVGGALAMTKEHVTKANGYSNLYFGWGAEDDDLSSRIGAAGFYIYRNPASISRYKMISHHRDKDNPVNNLRLTLWWNTKNRYKEEGVNSLNYTMVSDHSETKLFRHFTVKFNKCDVLRKWIKVYNLNINDCPKK